MPEYPLLLLPAPASPLERGKKTGRGSKFEKPSKDRQGQRITPQLTELQRAFESRTAQLQTDTTGIVPESVIVLEIVGTVEEFANAVMRIEGLEWLGEIEIEDIEPDDDFFVKDKEGEMREDKALKGRLFLVFSNQRAFRQILSLWERWKNDQELPHGEGRWATLFSQLRDIHPWGVKERLEETGVLDDWQLRLEHEEDIIPVEIELWYRASHEKRTSSGDTVKSLIESHGGEMVTESVIADIQYHAILAKLPVNEIEQFLTEDRSNINLLQCEQIQYFRASGQATKSIYDNEFDEEESDVEESNVSLLEPVVALFDGLPLQMHKCLAGRLDVDDPDGYEALYEATDRVHGTAMASLILHGDLNSGAPPLKRKIYVRPIMQPDLHEWRSPRTEMVSENELFVDLLFRAVRRLFEGEADEDAVAPNICVINLSIGIKDRVFHSALSPLARLIDWISWKYKVLFVVSAGNHVHNIELKYPRAEIEAESREFFQEKVLQAIAEDARNRRLLSPAESINSLTIGALHGDDSTGEVVARARDPFTGSLLPSVINAQGMGYRRAIKPDILVPGGRVALADGISTPDSTQYSVSTYYSKPGQRVAAPGDTAGDIGRTWYLRGTSNATACTSRLASSLYDMLEELISEPGGQLIHMIPRSIWIKALLVHSATWGEAFPLLKDILKTPENSKQFKEYISRLLGYGAIDENRIFECTEKRVTTLCGGLLRDEQSHIIEVPLPPSLIGINGLRRLIITLAWLTPINASHQGWRRADLWFDALPNPLELKKRKDADARAAKRGTVQHEIFERHKAAEFVDGDSLKIQVSCRRDAGVLEDEIPYAVVTTLEVSDAIGIDIYDEIKTKVEAAIVQVSSSQ